MAFGHVIVREVVHLFGCEIEITLVGYADRVLDRLRIRCEQRRHLVRRFQVELVVGTPLPVRFFERFVVLDGDEDVVQVAALAEVVVGVVGGDDGYTEVRADVRHEPVALGVVEHQILLQLKEEVVRTEPVPVLSAQPPGLAQPSRKNEFRDLAVTTA